jgi:signal transduction histidine kinase/ActR/RegA family two-component response regulator
MPTREGVPPLRQAVDEAHKQAASTVLAGAALLWFLSAAFDGATLRIEHQELVVAFDVVIAASCMGLRSLLSRRPVSGVRADAIWLALAGSMASDVLVTMSLTRQAAYGTFLTLLLLGAGFLMRSLALFSVFGSLVAAGWILVAVRTGWSIDAAPWLFGLVISYATGATLLVARSRAYARIALLRFRDRVRGERLRAALETARHTLSERDRTETEKERLRAALMQAQKMEAVGRLAGAVAHDINNVLTAIMSAAEMLLADSDLDAAGRDDVATILASSKRGAEFTQNLLAVGRQGKYASDVLDPADIVHGTERALEHALPIEVRLDVDLQHGAARVEGDLTQLTHSLLNVCTNALEAMPDGGSLLVRTSLVVLDGAEAHRRAVAPGEYLALSVTDSGEGMGSEDRQRAFEPFFTTKAPHAGAGLGLAMAYGTARNHGGNAEIESARGRGTTVTLHLPCAGAEARPPAQASSAPEGTPKHDPRGSRVLLVDDEASVRSVARRILERMHIEVHEAENGRRALVTFSSDGPFDLVVVDLTMPVMDGAELFARIRSMAPDARVVVVAGASDIPRAVELTETGAVGIVEKPYTPSGLTRAVRAGLRAAPPAAPKAQSA